MAKGFKARLQCRRLVCGFEPISNHRQRGALVVRMKRIPLVRVLYQGPRCVENHTHTHTGSEPKAKTILYVGGVVWFTSLASSHKLAGLRAPS